MLYILIVFNITCNYIISQRQFILCAILFMCHIYSNIYSHLVKLSGVSCRVASIYAYVFVQNLQMERSVNRSFFIHSLLLQLKKLYFSIVDLNKDQ